MEETFWTRLGPMMHGSGKVIFVNNHDKRIDLLRQTDGFFDEFTYAGSPLNLTALMGIRRPVLGWTSEEKNLRPDPDAFFQRYLHLGVFPMAPFPATTIHCSRARGSTGSIWITVRCSA